MFCRVSRRFLRTAALSLTLLGGVSVVLTSTGCGGSKSSSNNNSTTPITATIDWGARTRDISGPASALSCIISFQSGNPNGGGPIDFPAINRDTSQTGAYVQTWTSPSSIRTGSNRVNIRFYASPDGTGSAVADLTQATTISSSSNILGPFTLQSKIASVVIPSGQTVEFGGTGIIGLTAFDSTNAQIIGLTNNGSGTFSAPTTNATLTVTAAGDAIGIGLGATPVTAVVDGISSAATPVNAVIGGSSIVNTALLQTTASGLRYRDGLTGSGTAAAAGQSVTVDYVGYLSPNPTAPTDSDLDSGTYTRFDTSLQSGRTPLTFTLGTPTILPGFNEGIAGMKPGQTRLLVLPANLAYADHPNNPLIPANATLIFVVKLISVQ